LQNYGSDVIDDNGVRILTDNDLDGSDSWAVQRTRTDEADAFTWGTIIDQRDASGNDAGEIYDIVDVPDGMM